MNSKYRKLTWLLLIYIPFEKLWQVQKKKLIIEKIDIGGPSMIVPQQKISRISLSLLLKTIMRCWTIVEGSKRRLTLEQRRSFAAKV